MFKIGDRARLRDPKDGLCPICYEEYINRGYVVITEFTGPNHAIILAGEDPDLDHMTSLDNLLPYEQVQEKADV